MNLNYKLKTIAVILLIVLSGAIGFLVSWIRHPMVFSLQQPDKITMIQTFHYPALFVKQLTGDPDAGRKIFKEFCASCHAEQPVIDVHAPRIKDKKAWQMRKKLGMPLLLQITTQGIGAMPARGGCFECSDQQLQAAIEYLLLDT